MVDTFHRLSVFTQNVKIYLLYTKIIQSQHYEILEENRERWTDTPTEGVKTMYYAYIIVYLNSII